MTDDDLLLKCVKRDISAWDRFVRQYHSLVLRSVRYKLKRMNVRSLDHHARDITQDIFLMIWEDNRLSRVRTAASLRGWLAIISINYTSSYCARKLFKEENLMVSLDGPDGEECSPEAFVSRLSMPGAGISETIEYNDLREIVEREISKLTPKQRLALRLNLFDGQRYRDIARIMRVPENTVTTLIRRGKSRLARRLEVMLDKS